MSRTQNRETGYVTKIMKFNGENHKKVERQNVLLICIVKMSSVCHSDRAKRNAQNRLL